MFQYKCVVYSVYSDYENGQNGGSEKARCNSDGHTINIYYARYKCMHHTLEYDC